jgi:endonuclease YncB( thermonuclease family)
VTVDRYGRTVGHLWIGDRHINREMVREGHAWVYRQYLKDETMLDDETHAQKNEIGLWGLAETQRVPRRGIGGAAGGKQHRSLSLFPIRRSAATQIGSAAR